MAEEQGGGGVIPSPETIRDRMAETREALESEPQTAKSSLVGT